MKLLGMCSVLLVSLLIPPLMMSQAVTGGIRGTIQDESGAVIPGVSITATHKTLGITRQAVSDDTGTYLLPDLNAGEWEVKAQLESFQTQVQTFTVVTGSTGNVDFKLKVGASSEVVEVIGQAAQINTTEYKIDGVITRNRIENLPLNGRSFMSLALLEPGVAANYDPTPGWASTYFTISVGGSGAPESVVTVDGASTRERLSGATQNFSQESVQEFQISTFNFDLSTSGASVGAVNVISRTGSNAFHGSGFIFFRDQHMAAFPGLKRPCDPAVLANRVACGGGDPQLLAALEQPPFVRRQSGFTFSGPLKKDKTFFFTNYEYTNQVGAYSVAFSDPLFQGYNHLSPYPYKFRLFNARIDHKLNNRHTGFLRLSQDNNDGVQATAIESNWASIDNLRNQAAIGLNSVLTPHLVNDFRYSYSYVNEHFLRYGDKNCTNPKYCFNLGGPTITGFGMTIGIAGNVEQHRIQRTNQFTDNVYWSIGNHSVKFGGNWEKYNILGYWERNARGAFSLFSPAVVQQQNPALYAALPLTLRTTTAGVPTFAEMMQLPVNGNLTIGVGDPNWWGNYREPQARPNHLIRGYIQDSWRVRPSFTLNYGLSYVIETNWWDYDLDRPEYLRPILPGSNLGFIQRAEKNFGPAMGFSWSPGSDKKTVIRAGSGIYYAQEASQWKKTYERPLLGPAGNGQITFRTTNLPNPFFGQPGQVATLNFTSPTPFTGQNMLDLLPSIQSQLLAKWGSSQEAAKKDLSGPRGIDVVKQANLVFAGDRYPTPYTIHVTAGVQREIVRNLVVSADYVMRRGLKSGVSNQSHTWDANHFNKPRVTAINPTTGVVSFVRDPLIPLCVGNQADIVPFPCSTGPIIEYIPAYNSRYQALLIKVDRRFSGRLQFTGSYAFSRFTSSQASTTSPTDPSGGFFQDCRNCGYGINDADRPHRFTFNILYEIPDLKGGNRWIRQVLNGWTVSSITEMVSAPPMNVIIANVDLYGDGISTALVPGLKVREFGRGVDANQIRKLVANYNATYPTLPNPDGTFPTYRKRTAENQIIPVITLPDVFSNGDKFASTDLRVTKAVPIREGISLNLAVEGFNMFNISNLTNFNAILNQPAFGQPTDRVNQVFGSGGPRAFQISARLRF